MAFPSPIIASELVTLINHASSLLIRIHALIATTWHDADASAKVFAARLLLAEILDSMEAFKPKERK